MIPRYSLEQDGAIEPETHVMICTYVLHRDPRIWTRANEFVPSRFERALPHGAYLPFGTGARRCIGAGFALTAMNVVLSTLLRHARFERIERKIRYRTLLTLRPRRLMCAVRGADA
jgi:cytochrome P450